MKQKAFNWAMKTPLAPVDCPHCGKRLSVGVEFKVGTRPKVWKVVKNPSKDVKSDE